MTARSEPKACIPEPIVMADKAMIFPAPFYGSNEAGVENVAKKTLSRVRVEVHLSNGNELGPTKPINLAPGKKVDVTLSAEG